MGDAARRLDYDTQEKDRDVWEEYERRKAELQRQDLTTAEYEAAIRTITEELGI